MNNSKLSNIGIALDRSQGKTLGSPQINYSNLTNEQKFFIEKNYDRWKTGDIKGVEFMKLLDLKKNTFYKVIHQYETLYISKKISPNTVNFGN